MKHKEIRLVLFDLDGTLITSYMDELNKDFHRWSVYPEVPGVIAGLKSNGIKVGIITNQAGIAFGYNTEADFEEKISRVKRMLGIEHVWVCFHHPKADPPYNNSRECLRRKPNAAMLEEAMAFFGATTDQTLFVGDMDSDAEAARHAHTYYTDANAFFDRDPNVVAGAGWANYARSTA